MFEGKQFLLTDTVIGTGTDTVQNGDFLKIRWIVRDLEKREIARIDRSRVLRVSDSLLPPSV